MTFFTKFTSSVLLAILYASFASVQLPSAEAKHQTHRKIVISRDFQIEAYYPPTTYQTFADGVDHPLSEQGVFSVEAAAVAFVQSRANVSAGSVRYNSGYSRGGSSSAYLQQSHKGIIFANAVANLAFNKDNKVIAYGSSFVKLKAIASSIPSLSVDTATEIAEKALLGKYDGTPRTLEYFAKEDGTAVLTHTIQIHNEQTGTYYKGLISAHTGEVVSVIDFVAQATYLALPIAKRAPTEGFEIIVNPENLAASPLGWHSSKVTNFTTTSGNNIIAYKTSSVTGLTPQSSSNLTFEYSWDSALEPNAASNLDAARVNAFYVANAFHDLLYTYNFTETTFNFQVNNLNKGGKASDPVRISVQDASGMNNALFTTLPDGQGGQMKMFLWNYNTPQRDGALENDVIIHEYTHGLTNRMTGGGTASCLQTGEARGMGEGWSDSLADWTAQTSSEVYDFVLGEYVYGVGGVRSYPYSTNSTVNPLRYSDLPNRLFDGPHATGEIWANVLHNVYVALVAEHGWSATAWTDPSGTEGNIVFLTIFIHALTLQPCNPNFIQARNALILADAEKYDGLNKCLLWRQFASRGFGVNAEYYMDDSTVPEDCTTATPPESSTTSTLETTSTLVPISSSETLATTTSTLESSSTLVPTPTSDSTPPTGTATATTE